MSANGAQRNPSRHALADRAFSGLERYVPRYQSDYRLLRSILDASHALKKPSLASRAIRHAIQNSKREQEDGVDISPVPGQDILKAMEICVQWNDATSCGKILEAVESLNLPKPILESSYHLAVLAYARHGDTEQTERVLFDMQQRGMVLE